MPSTSALLGAFGLEYDSGQRSCQPDHRPVSRGSTLHPDFRPFSESASSAGAGLKAATAKALWWHVCNIHPQT
ncbi:MAG: hypothetical protein RBU21_23290, partial [FCB group bacterium]|nr:hypothetical protein [FCB group bacterium]